MVRVHDTGGVRHRTLDFVVCGTGLIFALILTAMISTVPIAMDPTDAGRLREAREWVAWQHTCGLFSDIPLSVPDIGMRLQVGAEYYSSPEEVPNKLSKKAKLRRFHVGDAG